MMKGKTMFDDKTKKELISHIIEQSRGQEMPTQADEFEAQLFEARVRNFLVNEQKG